MQTKPIKVKQFLFIMGPTGTGKSKFALEAAEKLGAEIVNCDSVQCYSKVSIGAASPSAADLARVPHHLYGYVQAPQELTVGQYYRHFFSELHKISADKIIVVGGTGFYFQALEKGLFDVAEVAPELKAEIEEWLSSEEGLKEAYAELIKLDPRAAEKISSQDAYRIGRAFELMRSENKTLTQIQGEFQEKGWPFPYPYAKMGLSLGREDLVPLIQRRTEKMIHEGLVDEVEGLLREGLRDWAPLRSVGYKETIQFIEEKKSLQWLREEICLRTLQLAKKQRTWFKRDAEAKWFHPLTDEAQILNFCQSSLA